MKTKQVKTKKEILLALFNKRKWLSTSLLKKTYDRYISRMSELRMDGYVFGKRKIEKGVNKGTNEYTLVKKTTK